MKFNDYHNNTLLYNEIERQKVWVPLVHYLQNKFKINGKVLDLGAGYCNFINNINNSDKYAVDIFKDIKKYANDNVKTYIKSCTDLKSFDSEFFDFVFASNLFEHLTDKQLNDTMKEILRVIKKDGKLILLQPNFRYGYKEYFDDPTHIKIFTDISIKKFLNMNSFEVIYIKKKFLPISIQSRLPKSTLLTTIYLYSPIKPLAKQMLVVAKKRY